MRNHSLSNWSRRLPSSEPFETLREFKCEKGTDVAPVGTVRGQEVVSFRTER